ncbi:MAG: DUF721 domain-containing protein [Methylococcales bacterium]|nr:DUF721 domain-containing protein [Methylococcales bacterium]
MNTFKTAKSYQLQILEKHQQKIKQHLSLLNIIKKSVTKPLSDHILHGAILNTSLVIYTNSALWASQLHFYQSAILKNLSLNGFTTLKSLHIKIISSEVSPKSKVSLERPSEKNIALVRHCSDSMQDEKLKKALLKLSKTLSNKSN